MPRPVRIVMIEDNPVEVQRMVNYIQPLDDIEFIASASTEEEGLKAVAKYHPDVILLDVELADGNGILFLPKLHACKLRVKPYILVITWTTDDATLQYLKANGVGFVQSKSAPRYEADGPRMVIDMLRELRPFFMDKSGVDNLVAVPPKNYDERKRMEITEAIGHIGVPAGKPGQLYLTEAILATRNNHCLVEMEKVIYPALIKKFGVSRDVIEKQMRAQIERAWKTTDTETLQAEYTQYTSPDKGKPTLSEFIGYYAQKLK